MVAFQLPNWVEAGITFWAAAYLGAVVVPIVHFYGAKEVDYILRTVSPDVMVTADRFGHNDYLATYEQLLSGRPDARGWWRGTPSRTALPPGARPFESHCSRPIRSRPAAGRSGHAGHHRLHLGHDPRPEGRDPLAPHHRVRDPPARLHVPHRWAAPDHRGPGRPLHRHAQRLPDARCCGTQPVNLIDVWDPAEVLRMMSEEGLGVGGGATYFLTSLLDHPDFTPEHLALMPFAGLGGSAVPVAVTRAGHRPRDEGVPLLREHRAPVDHRLPPRRPGGEAADHRRPGPARGGVRLDDDGQILSRGPDCFVGYTDPELTAAVFDADGWYRTGDVGVLDDDGYLTITDRISDIIIRGGENISAAEIEELLMGLDEVAEVVRGGRARRAPRRARRRGRPGAGGHGARRPSRRAGASGRGRAGPPEVARGPLRGRRAPRGRRRARSRSSCSASSSATAR